MVFAIRPRGDQASDEVVAIVARRQRILLAAAGVELAYGGSGKGPQGPKRTKLPFVWSVHRRRLLNKEFRARYRLTKTSVANLLRLLWPALQLPTTETSKGNQRDANCGANIEPATVLVVGLRFLAGGQVLDLKLIYKMQSSTVNRCVWKVVDAVNKIITVDFPIVDAQIYMISVHTRYVCDTACVCAYVLNVEYCIYNKYTFIYKNTTATM